MTHKDLHEHANNNILVQACIQDSYYLKTQIHYKYNSVYMGYSKINEIRYIFLYFRQLVLNKILAPDVFDYGDSKSESWHRAKKMRDSIYFFVLPTVL